MLRVAGVRDWRIDGLCRGNSERRGEVEGRRGKGELRGVPLNGRDRRVGNGGVQVSKMLLKVLLRLARREERRARQLAFERPRRVNAEGDQSLLSDSTSRTIIVSSVVEDLAILSCPTLLRCRRVEGGFVREERVGGREGWRLR